MNDTIRYMLEQQERMQSWLEPYHGNLALKAAIEDQRRVQDALGSFRLQLPEGLSSLHAEHSSWWECISEADESLRRLKAPLDQTRAVLEAAGLNDQVEKLMGLQAAAHRNLVLPEVETIAATIRALQAGLMTPNERLLEIAGQIRSPWLESEHEVRSLTAISKLSSIVGDLGSAFPYSEAVSGRLREVLGDWREIEPPEPGTLIMPEVRLTYYDERGVDFEATDLAPKAFDEVAGIIGLVAEDESEPENDTDRAMRVFRYLRETEELLRVFIAEALERAFGEEWVKRQVDVGLRKRWQERQKAALDNGRPEAPLIAFADFTDYVMLIERNDNWNNVFCGTFQRKADIQESLRRLAPIRVDGMHARLVTLEDELLVLSEMRRIRTAIDRARASWMR